LNFILKKILRKKTKKHKIFEIFFFDNLVGSTLGYHPKSIWTIFKAPNAS
jgi:hypothetical protein